MNRLALLLLALMLGGASALSGAPGRLPKGAGSSMYRVPGGPDILGPDSVDSGSTWTGTNAWMTVWTTPDGASTTNWDTFSATLVNSTLSPTNLAVLLRSNSHPTSRKTVTVNPVAPSANFSATPTSGPPPLAVVYSNLTSGAYTNMYWYFGDPEWTSPSEYSGAPTNSISVTYSQFSTNSPYLVVRGYSNSLLTKTNYITAVSNATQYALIFNGPGDPAVAYTVDADPMWTTPPYAVSVWINPGGISDSLRHVTGTGAEGQPGGQYDWSWRFEGGPHGDGTGEAIWAGYATGFAGAVWPDYSAWVKLEWRVSADGTVVSNFVNDVFCSASDTGAFAYETPRRFAIGNSGESSPGNNAFGGVITDVCFYTNNVLAARWDMTTEGGTGTNVVDVIGGKNLIIYGGAIWTNIVTHP